MSAFKTCLQATAIIDSNHPGVIEFALSAVRGSSDPRAQAMALYYAVRDGFRYDTYQVDLSVPGLSASNVIAKTHGWCVPKAVLLAAACRVVGIPSRVGFADVRNHLSTARLREMMGSDVFYFHGYTAIYLEGAWVKATPAFNIELCTKLGLHPLEFDGRNDSIYHPFDLAGQRHMEYLNYRGEFDDVPHQELLDGFARYYPNLHRLDHASFDEDIDRELTARG